MILGNVKQGSARRVAHKGAVAGFSFVMIGLTGCPSTVLPESLTFPDVEFITVADGLTMEMPLGAGAPSLADSTWAIYRASDDSLLFRITFGANGEVERLFDSLVLAKEWLGSEIIPDTQAHPTDFPGGSYVCGAYTAELDGRVGVLGLLHGLLLGEHLGTATLSLSGSIEGERIDGTMTRTVTVFGTTPFAPPGDAEFDTYALREE